MCSTWDGLLFGVAGVPSLLRELDRDDEAVQARARRMLDALCYPRAFTLGGGLSYERSNEYIRSSGVAEPLLDALRLGGPKAIAYAASALGLMPEPRALPQLITLLSHPSAQVRAAAAKGLGFLRHSRAIDPLLVTLDDPDKDVRHAAADALGNLKARQAVTPLLAWLRDRDWQTRRYGYWCLRDIDDPRVLEAARHGAVNDPKPQVREAAKSVLATFDLRRRNRLAAD